jgi:hypothetical protein
MITYRVEDLGNDGHRFSVRDQHGHLHVARAVGATPGLGDGLLGQEAALGVRVLVHEGSNAPMQVSFEALVCSQGQALDLLHPTAEANGAPASRSPTDPWLCVRAGAPGRHGDPFRVEHSLD